MNSTLIKRSNLWEKRQLSSYNKWVVISALTQHGVSFVNLKGFKYLQVVNKCGYCYEFFDPDENCSNCILYKKKVCSKKISNVTFWKYVREMQRGIKNHPHVNWGKALSLSIVMREAISEDIFF